MWHNGGTGGYRSFIAFDPKRRTGIVVLSNMFTEQGVDDIGRHALDPSFPLNLAPVVSAQATVSPEVLERYAGRYELAPTFILTVRREGTQLFLQATGQPAFELFASDQRNFFLKAVDAQITFEVGPDGKATRLILHQNGANQPAKRIDRSSWMVAIRGFEPRFCG